jgi:hypothetical protein
MISSERKVWFVLREMYYWLVVDKPNEQGVHDKLPVWLLYMSIG